MTAMRTVRVEGKLADPVDMAELIDRLMDALIDLGAVDPFVYTDAGGPTFRADITVDAPSDVEALNEGVPLLTAALTAAGLVVEEPSVQSAELIPA